MPLSKENIPRKAESPKYNLDDFIETHSVRDVNAPKYAADIFNNGKISEALKYSEMVIKYNDDPYAIEALPILLSSYKHLKMDNDFNRSIPYLVKYLYQYGDDTHISKANDLALNTLQTVFSGYEYSIKEKKAFLKNLYSSDMPADIIKMANDFNNSLQEQCKDNGCESDNFTTYN